MANLNETEFKEKAERLFEELEERVKSLTIPGSLFKEVANLIEEAKSLLKDNKIPESLAKYNEALEKIHNAEISVSAEPLAWRLLYVEVAYLLLLLLLGYIALWSGPSRWRDLVNLHTQTVWFGALGGVTIALYGIYSHIQQRDFDPKYRLWYICKPIIGGIFGWFVYLVFYIGLISVQGVEIKDIKHPELPYVIAFLAGFSERFTIRIIDRLMSVLTTWQDTQTAAPESRKKPK